MANKIHIIVIQNIVNNGKWKKKKSDKNEILINNRINNSLTLLGKR